MSVAGSPAARPGCPPVTAARVIVIVFAVLLALGALAALALGVGTLVAGGSIAGAAAPDELVGAARGLLGGMVGAFGVLLLVLAVLYGGFAAFWFWAAAALGRGRAVARVLTTVFLGIGVAGVLVIALARIAAGDEGAGLAALLLLAAPVAVIVLLWGPESARRHFSPGPAGASPPPSGAVPAPRPSTGPMTAFEPASGWPLDASTDRLAPAQGPVPRCAHCGTGTERGWAHCGHCGSPLPGTRLAR